MKELPYRAYYQFWVLLDASNADMVSKILKHTYTGSENIVISFSLDGELPTKNKAEINIMVGTEYAGSTFYYYYYNPTDDMLEYLQSTVVDDGGWVTVEQSHCSDYLFTSKKLGSNNVIIKEIPGTGDQSLIPYYTEGVSENIVKFSAVISNRIHLVGDPSIEYLFKDNSKSFTDISGHWAVD